MRPARATHVGTYRRTAEPQTPAAIAWLARNGSRSQRREALREIRRKLGAHDKTEAARQKKNP